MKRDKEFKGRSDREWNERLHIGILIVLGLGIIIALIILFINRPDTMRTKVDNTDSNIITENIISEENKQIVDSNKDIELDYLIEQINNIKVKEATKADAGEITDTTETTEDGVVIEQRKINIGSNSQEVKDIADTNIVAGESLSLTRFQLANTLYKLLSGENKLPSIEGYQVTYEDNQDIPSNYLSAVCYTSYLKILDFGTKFNGYRYVTKEETDDAMKKLQTYLDNYSAPKEVEEAIDLERQALEQEAASVLKDRVTVDRLYGQSEAIHKNPKTLEELDENQSNITKTTFDDSDTTKKEYLNIDEALLNGKELSNMGYNTVIGVTYYEEGARFKASKLGEVLKLVSEDFDSKAIGSNVLLSDVVGIYENNIVMGGYHINEVGNECIVFEDYKNIDSIGYIIYRDTLENNDENSVDTLLLVVNLDSMCIDSIQRGE